MEVFDCLGRDQGENARADVYAEWHGLEEEELAFVSEGEVLLEARVDGMWWKASDMSMEVKWAPLGTEFLSFETVHILKVGQAM